MLLLLLLLLLWALGSGAERASRSCTDAAPDDLGAGRWTLNGGRCSASGEPGCAALHGAARCAPHDACRTPVLVSAPACAPSALRPPPALALPPPACACTPLSGSPNPTTTCRHVLHCSHPTTNHTLCRQDPVLSESHPSHPPSSSSSSTVPFLDLIFVIYSTSSHLPPPSHSLAPPPSHLSP